MLRATITILGLTGVALLAAACGTERATTAAASTHTAPIAFTNANGTLAQRVRADALLGVAKNIWREEANGQVSHDAVKRLARDPALVGSLQSGDPAAMRAAFLNQLYNPGKHVVRLSVVRNGHPVVDVGGAFVVTPARLVLPNGLGTLEASVQDVIGYVKLIQIGRAHV